MLKKGCLGIVVLVLFLMALGALFGDDAPQPGPVATDVVPGARPNVAGPAVAVGAQARIYVEGAQSVYLAVDRDAMEELLDVQNASDVDGLRRLGQQGKVLQVPNNTDARVVERSMLLTKVRVTEPDRVYTGSEGWLQNEFVQAAGRDDAAAAGLPEYTVIDKVGDNLEVLVPSLSVDAPDAEIEAVARSIASAERVGTIYLYRTEDAQKANMSASFAERHPDAMAEGYLGVLRGGAFEPSSY